MFFERGSCLDQRHATACRGLRRPWRAFQGWRYLVEKDAPDVRWPRERLVIEADGAAWHDNRIAREDDAERQALLEAHGERVVRVTWEQAVARAGETLARFRAAGAPRAQACRLRAAM